MPWKLNVLMTTEIYLTKAKSLLPTTNVAQNPNSILSVYRYWYVRLILLLLFLLCFFLKKCTALRNQENLNELAASILHSYTAHTNMLQVNDTWTRCVWEYQLLLYLMMRLDNIKQSPSKYLLSFHYLICTKNRASIFSLGYCLHVLLIVYKQENKIHTGQIK